MTKTTSEQWQKRVGSPYLPSKYQCDIFEEIVNGRGNSVIEAVAGSGKSTTIMFGAQLIVGMGVYIAFSKAVVEEVRPNLQGTNMEPRTVHSIGNGAIWFNNRHLKIQIEDPKKGVSKYKARVKTIEKDLQRSGIFLGRKLKDSESKALQDNKKKFRLPLGIILDLFSKARLDLIDFDGPNYRSDLWDLANHHNVTVPKNIDNVIADVIQHLADWGCKNIAIIDFTDMVWLPVVNNYRPKQWSWVFVDECQDISPAQLALIKKCIRSGGRTMWVGDRHQAIFGFAGANSQSFQQIVEDMKAKILPLSVCYRCPTSGIDIAKQWVPQIESAPGAIEGSTQKVKYDEMKEMVREGDMILCRRNAPLVDAAFSIIAQGIPAIVKGRSIGEGLVKTIEIIAHGATFDGFGEHLEKWLTKEKERITARGGDKSMTAQKCIMLDDTAECIRIVYQREDINSFQELIGSIANLFSDENGSVTLCSIHRAKGLENDRIFILGPTEISFRGQRDWQREQEANLSYVAHTRHKEDLVFVEEKARE